MVKFVLFVLFSLSLYGNIFQKNCLSCHTDEYELKTYMANYTLEYSSEKRVKKAIYRFLRNPTSNRSIMPYSYIVEYGFKKDSNLSDENLQKAIDQYYELYNIKQFIK